MLQALSSCWCLLHCHAIHGMLLLLLLPLLRWAIWPILLRVKCRHALRLLLLVGLQHVLHRTEQPFKNGVGVTGRMLLLLLLLHVVCRYAFRLLQASTSQVNNWGGSMPHVVHTSCSRRCCWFSSGNATTSSSRQV